MGRQAVMIKTCLPPFYGKHVDGCNKYKII